MMDTDEIEIFAMKKPVWSFKYGPLMGYFVSFNFNCQFDYEGFLG